jgi:glycosyltransferase involved in cell wall biosynthesis
MNITVILCTYNRCESLTKTLESIAVLRLPESVEWEILVVDNNSTDQTRKVVEDFCRRYPNRFRYVAEPRQGLSNARNAGIREARGDVLVFTDDDVTFEPTWLQNLTKPLHNSQWAGVGGRIFPERAFSAPYWLALDGPYGMGGVLAFFDLGPEPSDLAEPPWGANMAYRKEMFEMYGSFRTDLGRCRGSLIGGEDTEFGRRLLSAGERLRYEPSAIVYHRVPKNRLHKSYFLAWWFNFGRAAVREAGRRPDTAKPHSRHSSAAKMSGTMQAITKLRLMLTLDPQQRFYYMTRSWKAAGEIVEKCCQLLDTKK